MVRHDLVRSFYEYTTKRVVSISRLFPSTLIVLCPSKIKGAHSGGPFVAGTDRPSYVARVVDWVACKLPTYLLLTYFQRGFIVSTDAYREKAYRHSAIAMTGKYSRSPLKLLCLSAGLCMLDAGHVPTAFVEGSSVP